MLRCTGGEYKGALLQYLYKIVYIHRLGVDPHQGRQELQRDIHQRQTTQFRGERERAVQTQIGQYRRMYPLCF